MLWAKDGSTVYGCKNKKVTNSYVLVIKESTQFNQTKHFSQKIQYFLKER